MSLQQQQQTGGGGAGVERDRGERDVKDKPLSGIPGADKVAAQPQAGAPLAGK